jgi:hypothetical protein
VRVTFPDGRRTVRTGVTPRSRIAIVPDAGLPATASLDRSRPNARPR